MKKSEAKPIIISLFDEWHKKNYPNTSPVDLDFYDFYNWLKDNHPNLTKFRSVMGPMEDIESWFAENFKQKWKY